MAGSFHPAGNVRLNWYGEQVKLTVFDITKRRVKQAVSILHAKIVHNISVPVGIVSGPRGGITKIRSKPGEYPRRDFENLINTMQSGVVIIPPGIYDGWVGSPLDYAVYLELGTRKMAPRPFLTRTLAENSVALKAVLTKPLGV